MDMSCFIYCGLETRKSHQLHSCIYRVVIHVHTSTLDSYRSSSLRLDLRSLFVMGGGCTHVLDLQVLLPGLLDEGVQLGFSLAGLPRVGPVRAEHLLDLLQGLAAGFGVSTYNH